jgi:hypothetical protein
MCCRSLYIVAEMGGEAICCDFDWLHFLGYAIVKG